MMTSVSSWCVLNSCLAFSVPLWISVGTGLDPVTTSFFLLEGSLPYQKALCKSYLLIVLCSWSQSVRLVEEAVVLICVPYTKTAKYGDRCFMKAAANLWNPLPVFLKFSVSVSSFKRNLKTYLFKRAYDK